MTATWKHPADHDPIHMKATEWLLRLADPNVSQEDILAWQAWMKQDARHEVAFLRMEEVQALVRALHRPPMPGQRELARDTDQASPPMSDRVSRSHRMRGPVALAASVVVATVALMILATQWRGAASVSSRPFLFATRVGENRLIQLADGSTVMLGGDSQINVSFGARERHIELTRGEAFFIVAKEPERPLKVAAGHAMVVAIGTQFDVRCATDRVIVNVVEGRVEVAPRPTLVPVPMLQALQPNLPVQVRAGERTTVDSTRVEPAARVADLGDALSWRSGRLAFRMRPLGQVLEDVNRYSLKPIAIADPDIAAVKVTGTVDGSNVSGWIASLPLALGIVADEEPDRIVLRRAR